MQRAVPGPLFFIDHHHIRPAAELTRPPPLILIVLSLLPEPRVHTDGRPTAFAEGGVAGGHLLEVPREQTQGHLWRCGVSN